MLAARYFYESSISRLISHFLFSQFIIFFSHLTLSDETTFKDALNYNALLFGNYEAQSSDVEGRLAVAGNISLNHYSIGDKLPVQSGDVLISGADIVFPSGRVYNGNIRAAGSVEAVGDPVRSGLESYASLEGNAHLNIDFNVLKADLLRASTSLSQLPANTSYEYKWGGLYLTGDCQSPHQIFHLPGEQVMNAHTFSVKCIPAKATVIVNIDGEHTGLTNMSLESLHAHRERTVFNFYQAKQLTFHGIGVEGMVLASEADLINPQGVIYGTLIANNWQGMMQLNHHRFNGDILSLLPSENLPPQVEVIDNQQTDKGSYFSLQVVASDQDNDRLTYSIDSTLSSLSIHPDTGLLSANLDYLSAGLYDVTIKVSDGQSDVYESFVLAVNNVNRQPEIISNPVTQAVINEDYTYQLAFTDLDFDDIHYFELINGPQGLTLGLLTGEINWLPNAGHIGEHELSVRVVDNHGAEGLQSFTLIISENNNRPPKIISKPTISTVAFEPYQYQVTAIDADNDTIAYELIDGPDGMEISLMSGLLTWTPVTEHVDETFQIRVKAIDSRGAYSIQSYRLTVIQHANHPPVIHSEPPAQVYEGELYTYAVIASDEDADTLLYSLENKPEGMFIHPATGLISFVPAPSLVGEHAVSVWVDDGRGGVTTQQYQLRVLSLQDREGPKFVSAPPLSVDEGAIYSYIPAVEASSHQLLGFSHQTALPTSIFTPLSGALSWPHQPSQKLPVNQQSLDYCDDGVVDLPDYIISHLAYDSDGQQLFASIKNRGFTLQHAPLEVAFYIDQQEIKVEQLSSLASRQEMILSLNNVVLKGDETVAVAINPTQSVPECIYANNEAQAYAVKLVVSNQYEQSDTQSYLININDVNEAPAIINTPLVTKTYAGETYNHQIMAIDKDLGDQLSYSLKEKVEGLQINERIGAIDWIPTENQIGSHAITLQVEDLSGAMVSQTMTLEVLPAPNLPPYFTSTPVKFAQENAKYSYRAIAVDPEARDLIYSLVKAPRDASIQASSGTIGWMPQLDYQLPIAADAPVCQHSIDLAIQSVDYDQAANQVKVKLANQGRLDLSTAVDVAIFYGEDTFLETPLNQVTLDALASGENTTVSLPLAKEALTDDVRVVLNKDQAFNECNTGNNEQLSASFVIKVEDDEGQSALQYYLVNVEQLNKPPAFTNSASLHEIQSGSLFSLDLTAQDLNRGDYIRYSLLSAPEGVQLNEETGQLTWTAPEDEGQTIIEVEAIDIKGGSSTIAIPVSVYSNRPPIITSEPISELIFTGAAGNGDIIDLSTWEPIIDFGSGTQEDALWIVSDDGTSVRQVFNAKSSAFISDFSISNAQIKGRFKVNTSFDDDFIGFVFGYQNNQQYYLFSWKQGTQENATRGIKVVKFDLEEGRTPSLWVDNPSNGTVLYRNTDFGWNDFIWYDFVLTFHSGEFTISLYQEEVLLDTFTLQDDTFSEGNFGFYNYSQDEVFYQGFESERLASRSYQYPVIATDPDNDSLTYSLVEAPDGMVIDAATGVISWPTTTANLAVHSVMVSVTDPSGLTDQQHYNLSILDKQPAIDTAPVTKAYAERLYAYDVGAIDPDDSLVTYALTEAPEGMLIDPATGLITWMPSMIHLGHHTISVTATNLGGYSFEQSFELEVVELPVTTAPEFTSTPITTMSLGEQFRYSPQVFDADGDQVSVSLVSVPRGMVTLVPKREEQQSGENTNAFDIYWWPEADELGEHEIIIEANDGKFGVTQQVFTLEVLPVNESPVITSEAPEAEAGTAYHYQVMATDSEGDSLSYSLNESPKNMTISEGGLLHWPADQVLPGNYEVIVQVADDRSGIALQRFSLQVAAPDTPPAVIQITSTPITAIILPLSYRYEVEATLSDGNELTYRLLEAPEGMALNLTTGVLDWQPVTAGYYPVVIEVQGSQVSAQQTFTLAVTKPLNAAPEIISQPDPLAYVGASFSYQVELNQSDDYQFNLATAPSGASITDTGLVTWSPEVTDAGDHLFVLEALSEQYRVSQSFVLSIRENQAPQLVYMPPVTAIIGEHYQHEIAIYDETPDRVITRLTASPEGMMLKDQQIHWTPSVSQAGIHPLTIELEDAQGLVSTKSFDIAAREPLSQGEITLLAEDLDYYAVAGYLYRYQIKVAEGDSGLYEYGFSRHPAGMTLSSDGMIEWAPTLEQAGEHEIEFYVQNAENRATISYTLSVDAYPRPLTLAVFFEPQFILPGEQGTMTVQALGGIGDSALSVLIDGQPVTLNKDHTAPFTATEIGRHDVTVTFSRGDDSLTVTDFFTVIDDTDQDSPEVNFIGPVSGQVITAPVDISFNVNDPNLVHYDVALYSSRQAQPTILLEGQTSNGEAQTVTVDPTLLLNGQYKLQLTALDTNGQSSATAASLIVEGNMKVGHFSFSEEDVNLPLMGMPLTVTRTYDSRRRHEQLDMGQGWSIDYQDIIVEENNEPSWNWRMYQQAGIYRIGIEQVRLTGTCVSSNGNNTVTITLPNGDVEKFKVRAKNAQTDAQDIYNPDCYLSASRYVELEFEALGDTSSTLKTLHNNQLFVLDPNGGPLVADIVDSEPARIDDYVLTTRSGYIYELNQYEGIRKITDPYGNTLTYSQDGLIHSAGESVLFERNARGLIEAVTLPTGEQTVYTYDSQANLIAVTDAAGATTHYRYNDDHHLTEMIDPLGRGIAKNLYNDEGRLVAQVDAEGNRTDFDHDIEGRQQVSTDRLGRTTIHSYDERGNVLAMVDALGEVTTYTYDADDNQTSKTNPLGDTETATYNAKGDELTTTNALGHTTAFTYNDKGQTLSVTDAKGQVHTQVYSEQGGLLSIKDPLGNEARNTYDLNGQVSSTTNALGHTTHFSYNGKGHKTREEDPLGHKVTSRYDKKGNVIEESWTRDHLGTEQSESTQYAYDAEDRLTRTTDALGHVTRSDYDALGNEIATIDALGRRTEHTYDSYRRLIRTDFADGTFITKTYDAEGNLLTDTDQAGRTTTYSYDKLNRLVQTLYPNGQRATMVYDAAGRLVEETSASGITTGYQYDAAGRRIQHTDALGHSTHYSYDANGNLLSITDPEGVITNYSYNALDQRTSVRYHNDTTEQTQFDALSRRTQQHDQQGIATAFDYDAVGRLITVTDALGGKTHYSYDKTGNKLSQTDALGRTTAWAYDALGRVISRTLPLGQRESFTYDAVGNKLTHTDFNGDTTYYRYHPLTDYLIQIDYADGASEEFTHDAIGNVLTATQDDGQGLVRITRYAYDLQDRLVKETQPTGVTLNYRYDANGNRSAVTVQTGLLTRTTSYRYDTLNRLASMTDYQGQVTDYTYDKAGNLIQVQYPNGNRATYQYDAVHQLIEVRHTDANEQLLEHFVYQLDDTGRRTQLSTVDGTITEYRYDELYRLLDETITSADSSTYSSSFTYDEVSNRIEQRVNGQTTAYRYDDNDRLTATTGAINQAFTYDESGNTLTATTDDEVRTYGYNAKHKLTTVETTTDSLSYQYSIEGIRNQKTENSLTTTFVVDHNRDYAQVLLEQTDQHIKHFIYGLDLVSQSTEGEDATGNNFRFYLYDGLGSTRALTDATGTITDRYDYSAYGELIHHSGTTDNHYLYAGEQLDQTLGQYYLRARYYDHAQGRFTQMDSYQGRMHEPVTLHKYLYANADPIRFVDPSGYFGIGAVLRTMASLMKYGANAAARASGGANSYLKFVSKGGKAVRVRLTYMKQVRAGRKMIDDFYKQKRKMSPSQRAKAEEAFARKVHQMRRNYAEQMKKETPEPFREWVLKLNKGRRSGDPLGPSYEYMRNVQGKSPSEIIHSAFKPMPFWRVAFKLVGIGVRGG